MEENGRVLAVALITLTIILRADKTWTSSNGLLGLVAHLVSPYFQAILFFKIKYLNKILQQLLEFENSEFQYEIVGVRFTSFRIKR